MPIPSGTCQVGREAEALFGLSHEVCAACSRTLDVKAQQMMQDPNMMAQAPKKPADTLKAGLKPLL